MARRTTLRDIATAVGVSITTVSLVLNGKPARVSEQIRQQIKDTAQQLQYVPNQNARSLVTNSTMLIVLIVPDIENMYFASLARRIEESCQKQGYSLIIANSDDSRDTERELIRKLTARNIDGLLCIPSTESYIYEQEWRHEIRNIPCPVTLIDRMVTSEICDGVGFDDFEGGRIAARHLIAAGHTRIGCISGSEQMLSSNRRWAGFVQALKEADIPVIPDLHVTGDYRVDSGYVAAQAMIEGNATAVFCCNDLMALGFMKRLKELGIRCPEDISLIGYDNILPRFGMQTEVTTVEQDISLLAQESWNMLYQRICEEKSDDFGWISRPETRILTPKLIENGTVQMLNERDL